MDRKKQIAALAESDAERQTLIRACERMERAREHEQPSATAFLSPREQALMKTLLPWCLFWGGAEGAEQNPDDGLPDKQATSFIVKKAIAYIEQNYAKKLSLQEVADFCYVSQWHLLKLINKYAEKSYYDLLNSVRIEKAKELLADPSLKIGDIVDLVGYSDSGHFSRTFKKLTGLSANEYRSRLK